MNIAVGAAEPRVEQLKWREIRNGAYLESSTTYAEQSSSDEEYKGNRIQDVKQVPLDASVAGVMVANIVGRLGEGSAIREKEGNGYRIKVNAVKQFKEHYPHVEIEDGVVGSRAKAE